MPRTASRFQFGQSIIDVVDHAEDDHVLLTVSKERWDEDHIQFVVPRHVAVAVGTMLAGERRDG